MSYQAIARKWRPTTFEEISGQGHVTRTLKNALELDRIHHALLFTGPRGVGKTTAARAMSRALNCAEGPTPTPCGACDSCREGLMGNSPDVVEIDGASNNSVANIRDLRDTVHYLPQGRYRVYIIDEVHMLSQGAFNALLKTLEEPPPHVVFIFATTEPQKIPDTVLSRVQRFDFKRIPASVVVARLRTICEAESVQISDNALRLIARAGEGSMRDAQSLLDQVIAFGGDEISDSATAEILGLVDRGLLYAMLEGLLKGEPERCLDAIAQVHGYGYELSEFTSELLELLRNAALVSLSPKSLRHVDLPEEELRQLQSICEGVSVDVFNRYFQAMLETHDQVSRSSRPRLVLDMAVARLASVRPVRPVDQLLAQIEACERRIRALGGRPGGYSGPSGPGPGGSRRGPTDREPTEQSRSGAQPPPPAGPRAEAPSPAAAPRADSPPEAPRSAPRPVAPPTSAAPPARAAPRPQRPAQPPVTRRRGVGAAPAQASTEPEPNDPQPPQEEGVGLTLHTDNEARYRQLLNELQPLGVRYVPLVESSVFAGQVGGALRIGFASTFTLKRGEDLIRDPEVVERARRLFPGVQVLEAIARDSDALTQKEARVIRREKHTAALWDEARADPMIGALCEALGATIENVVPLSIPEESS